MDGDSRRQWFFHQLSLEKVNVVANALSQRAGIAHLLVAEALESLRTGVVLKLIQQIGLQR